MKNKYLTERERYQIESLLKAKTPVKEIACIIGKCQATIYNEIKRGQTTLLNSDLTERTEYLADVAQAKAEYNATNKGRDLKLGNDFAFVEYATDLILNRKYSPYAVLQQMKKDQKSFPTSICKNTLYKYIRMGLFTGVSMSSLPMPRKIQKRERVKRRKVALNNIVCKSIEDRDKDILKRDQYGHWEMDTVVSGRGGKGVLLVFTERQTRFEEIYKINSKSADAVVRCINSIERKMGVTAFRQKFKTITCDNGCEFLDAKGIATSFRSKQLRTSLYFCHPYCSSERGSNENANKLIRRWIPKGSDISQYSKEYVQKIQDWMNNYPRQLHGGLSAIEYLDSLSV